jgi:hypothetical protein
MSSRGDMRPSRYRYRVPIEAARDGWPASEPAQEGQVRKGCARCTSFAQRLPRSGPRVDWRLGTKWAIDRLFGGKKSR